MTTPYKQSECKWELVEHPGGEIQWVRLSGDADCDLPAVEFDDNKVGSIVTVKQTITISGGGSVAKKAVRKSVVKKAPAKKAPVKKAPVKKAPVKKASTPAKKSPVKKKAPVKKTTARK